MDHEWVTTLRILRDTNSPPYSRPVLQNKICRVIKKLHKAEMETMVGKYGSAIVKLVIRFMLLIQLFIYLFIFIYLTNYTILICLFALYLLSTWKNMSYAIIIIIIIIQITILTFCQIIYRYFKMYFYTVLMILMIGT